MPTLSREVSQVSAFTVVSTFAGCGGSSTGYKLAGGKMLLAVEWDEHAVATYRANFPTTDVHHGDVAKLSAEHVLERIGLKPGQLDIFDGSPPCQGFSTAGARNLEDSRNSLFREYVRLLRGLKPRCFVMENVSGMVKGKMRLVFAEAMRELKASGYRVRCQLLNAMYFGVPQARQRVIFIGVREDLGMEPSYPKPQSRPIPIRDVILETKCVREGFGTTRLAGLKNAQFNNKWRQANRPSPTITKTRPPILLLSNGTQREMTPQECARVGSFPDDFIWLGTPRQIINRIGNSVPPLLMKAIAVHVRDEILAKAVQSET